MKRLKYRYLLIGFWSVLTISVGSTLTNAKESMQSDKNNTLVPFDFTVQKGLSNTCQFDDIQLPDAFEIYAIGNYSGKKTDYQIDDSGHQATQFDIAIDSPNKPVALILGAYEPSIWNIGWTQETKIIAIYAMGYHRQVVTGIPADIPLIINGMGGSGCTSFYLSEKNINKLNPLSTKLFKKDVSEVYLADRTGGKVLIKKGTSESLQFVTDASNPPSNYYIQKNLAGRAGLVEAINQGLIRPANAKDIMDWQNAQEKLMHKKNEQQPPIIGGTSEQTRRVTPQMMGFQNAYVILKEFTIPGGLYGAHSVTFFVAKGAPYPQGNPGHSTIYDLNSLSCTGTGCSMNFD